MNTFYRIVGFPFRTAWACFGLFVIFVGNLFTVLPVTVNWPHFWRFCCGLEESDIDFSS